MTRRSRDEIVTMEVRISRLIEALRSSLNPVQFDLACRLWCCQQQRNERRAGKRDRVDRPCRSIACEHCRRWRGKEWRARAAIQMAHADNAHASMVTIMLERTGSFEDLHHVVKGFRTALRNLRSRLADDDARWRQLSAVGLCEVDLLLSDDLVLLPPSRRAVVMALPVRSRVEQVTLAVHVHLAVSHPSIPRHAIERVVMQQWPGRGRVDVRPLRQDATAADNAGAIVGYASKHSMLTAFSGDVETTDPDESKEPIKVSVPIELQAAYWGWLHGLGCGLAPLRVRMGVMRDRNSAFPSPALFQRMVKEPMPIVL